MTEMHYLLTVHTHTYTAPIDLSDIYTQTEISSKNIRHKPLMDKEPKQLAQPNTLQQ